MNETLEKLTNFVRMFLIKYVFSFDFSVCSFLRFVFGLLEFLN